MNVNVSMGDCPWGEHHPPHLWAEEHTYPDGSAETVVFARTGTVES